MCIRLYLYFEIKRLPRYPHLSSLQHEIKPPISSFLLYRAFLAKERNIMHRNITLNILLSARDLSKISRGGGRVGILNLGSEMR